MSVYEYYLLLYYLYSVLLQVLCAGWNGQYYISTEHPALTHFNPKYFSYLNITSRRHGRRDPMYYVDIHYRSLVPFDDTIRVAFYFYEFLSNEYRRGFVEMHFGWCSLIHKDPFFGAAMNQGKLRRPCPFPPDDYHMYNMSIPTTAIPPGFPFTKGRIYANGTQRGTVIFAGYIDMELKQKRISPGKI